jgi:hypothetical protein
MYRSLINICIVFVDRKNIPSIVVDFTPEDTTDDVIIDDDSESDPDEMDDAGVL